MRRESLRAGIRAGIPFALAAGLLAVAFGVVAEPVLGTEATLAMSAFVFAGSAQFGSVAVLAGGGGLGAAASAAVLLNARYLPMGIALAPSLRGRPLRRAAYGEAMIDASRVMANRGGAVSIRTSSSERPCPPIPPGWAALRSVCSPGT
jgi:predicted branched-subunit amino acid permease